jgi:hypothetical protein
VSTRAERRCEVSQRIRITVKRREQIDVDKLVFALLRVIDQLEEPQTPAADHEHLEGGDDQHEEPAK